MTTAESNIIHHKAYKYKISEKKQKPNLIFNGIETNCECLKTWKFIGEKYQFHFIAVIQHIAVVFLFSKREKKTNSPRNRSISLNSHASKSILFSYHLAILTVYYAYL